MRPQDAQQEALKIGLSQQGSQHGLSQHAQHTRNSLATQRATPFCLVSQHAQQAPISACARCECSDPSDTKISAIATWAEQASTAALDGYEPEPELEAQKSGAAPRLAPHHSYREDQR